MEEKNLPNKAYSLVKVGTKYYTIEIAFNFETGEVGSMTKLVESDSRMHGIESFKIAIGNAKLFTDGL